MLKGCCYYKFAVFLLPCGPFSTIIKKILNTFSKPHIHCVLEMCVCIHTYMWHIYHIYKTLILYTVPFFELCIHTVSLYACGVGSMSTQSWYPSSGGKVQCPVHLWPVPVRLLSGRDEGSSRRAGLRKLTFAVTIRHCGTTNFLQMKPLGTVRNGGHASIPLAFLPFLLSFFSISAEGIRLNT